MWCTIVIIQILLHKLTTIILRESFFQSSVWSPWNQVNNMYIILQAIRKLVYDLEVNQAGCIFCSLFIGSWQLPGQIMSAALHVCEALYCISIQTAKCPVIHEGKYFDIVSWWSVVWILRLKAKTYILSFQLLYNFLAKKLCKRPHLTPRHCCFSVRWCGAGLPQPPL